MTESEKMKAFWGLSQMNFIALHRSIIQEMPIDLQDRLADMLNELDNQTVDPRPDAIPTVSSYTLIARGANGKIIKDPMGPYRHGNEYAKMLVKKE
jgi:hypothetical protein